MLLIRRFEEKSAQMYGLQKIGGFCHLYIGQEAVCSGSIANLDMSKDYVLCSYRDHGHALACGMEPNAVMAELFGRIGGCSRGKGGSMHLFDAEKHFLGGNGIVGSHIPVAAGVALKIKYREEDGVVLCFFGDGAIHQGAFHEAANMAALWKLPIVFICENNLYAMGTHFRRTSSVDDLSVKAQAYGFPGRQVDGMDVLEVYDEVNLAVQQAREEGTPTLLEIRTYRYKGHSMSDPGKYRTKEEVKEKKAFDPILSLKERMLSDGMITEAEYKEMDKELREICTASVKFAESSPVPPLSELHQDVYAD
jgi:pyruvate dehydrogenase E1 component alpha subunit